MNLQPQFGSDEERAARRLIEQASSILKGLRGGISESFVTVLFAGCVVIVGAAGATAPDGILRITFVCEATVPVVIDHVPDDAPAGIVWLLVWAVPLFQWYVTSTGAPEAGIVYVPLNRR